MDGVSGRQPGETFREGCQPSATAATLSAATDLRPDTHTARETQ
jgi:hypothetical protein